MLSFIRRTCLRPQRFFSAAPSKIPGFRAPGQVPTDWEISTGLERKELEGELSNTPVFDMEPIVLGHKPTVSNPVLLYGSDVERYVGCTGYPADTHEVVWLTGVDRCPHCGTAFKYTQYKEEH